jgi:hypothetical protein
MVFSFVVGHEIRSFSVMKTHRWLSASIAGCLTFCGNLAASRAGAGGIVLSNPTRNEAGQFVVRWNAETNSFANVYFTVEKAVSLDSPFSALSPPVPESGSLCFTDTAPSAVSSAIYRVSTSPAFTALNQSGAFASFAATNVNGLNTVGYSGAIFDGRYIYFVPYQNSVGSHGRVLRYDTQSSFNSPASWAAYDASGTGSGGAVGYTGGVFDGRFIYFSPTAGHGRVLRYDTQGTFTNAASWGLYDAGATDGFVTVGFQGAIFDGQFVYFVPHYNGVGAGWNGIVVRYDTRGVFTNAASWHACDAGSTSGLNTKGYSSGVFDGRFVYFSPIVNGAPSGAVLRYDPTSPFTNAASWLAYDASHTAGLKCTAFKGAVFDGRYIFFAPYPNGGACVVLRYDTQAAFTNSNSWSAYNATNTAGLATDGYDGAVFDGRFVYFTPYHDSNNNFHARVLSYDTQAGFTNAASWHAFDAGGTGGLPTQGYVGAVSDGRYLYFAPYRNTNDFHGFVLRFDARLPKQMPVSVSGGSNL